MIGLIASHLWIFDLFDWVNGYVISSVILIYFLTSSITSTGYSKVGHRRL